MNVNVEGIKVGGWRELTSEEMQLINKLVAESSKTEEASKDILKKKYLPRQKNIYRDKK